jgi:uncharacterized peroxidase-related enzyme
MEHIVETHRRSKSHPGSIQSLPNRSPNPNEECHHSRLSVPTLESDTGPSGQIYAQVKKAIGSVPKTFAAIAAHGPAALKSVLAADTVLAAGTLTKRDQEVIKLVISGAAGCDYCVAAHNYLAQLAGVRPDALKQIRAGQPTGDPKSDALVSFVRKLAQSSGTVSDEDFAAIKAAGYSDAQLVDISLAFATITFTNVLNRINDTEIDFPAVA